MAEWILTVPFMARIATISPGDDVPFGAELHDLAAGTAETISPKRLHQIERRLFSDEGLPSARQQAWFWYLAGTAYASREQLRRAFEAFTLSARAVEQAASPDLLVLAHLHFTLATVAQQQQRYLHALIACEAAINDMQQLSDQHDPALDAADWQEALNVARALNAEIRAALAAPPDSPPS
jgi:tetratricopeptide (TPR) repeat protein